MAITETLNVTSSTTSLTTSVGATDRELVKLYHVVASPASITLINSALYTITGYSDTSQKLSIVFDDWTDYVGDSILVVIYTDIDTGNVADAMLTNFGTAANISPTTLQNELAHLYYIIGQITGGAAVADASLADLSDAIARINNLAGKVFASTTTAGLPALWDGTDTLSIGGEDSVEEILTTHESRLDTAEPIIATHTAQLADTQTSTLKENLVASINNLARQIASGVGLPTPATSATNAAADGGAPLYILGADNISGAPEWIDLRNQTLPQSQPLDADLTAIAALSPTNDDILQRKSGAWVNRTMTQLRADLLAIENATIVCGHWNGEMSSVTSPFAQAYYERDVTVVAGAPYTSTVGLMFSAPFRWVTGMPTKIKVTADYQLVGTSDSGGTSTIKLQARIIELNALTSSMNAQVAAVAYSVLDTVDLNDALSFSFGNSLLDTTIKTATTSTLTFDTSKVYAVQFVFPVVVYGNGNARIRLYGYTAQWAV